MTHKKLILSRAFPVTREQLHPTAKAEHEVQRRLLLDVVVRQSTPVLELLAREDEALLVRWNALLVLDLLLHILNGVGWLHIEGDGLAGECFDEDLHATAKTKHQVESGLFLDVVVRQSAPVLELLAREDQALLIRWNA